MNTNDRSVRILPILDPSASHVFVEPVQRIHEPQDVSAFLVSQAYADIMTFLLQLNRSMFPSKLTDGTVQEWPLNSEDVQFSAPVRQLQRLLSKVEDIIQEVPPDTRPRRFGNISFRKWHEVLAERASDLLRECLPSELLERRSSVPNGATAESELKAYFLGSWGSGQRLDYGTGHELSFLAFLAAIWKLDGFPKTDYGVEERAIVLGIIEPYLELVRSLIKTYTLEPAGSHGVWGLDDHSFIPYIFGSAQLSPAITESDLTPEEGSLPNTPDPSAVAKVNVVEKERKTNLYFSAIGFIYDVKKGPFWEHSPMLYDISGIRAGWGKINKGMIKMYNAEVLSKFPVVQHFPFGSLFSFERDPTIAASPPAAHSTLGLQTRSLAVDAKSSSFTARPNVESGSRAPRATLGTDTRTLTMGSTGVPWAVGRQGDTSNGPPLDSTRPDISRPPQEPMAPTRAPWAKAQAPQASPSPGADGPSRAPRAN